MGQRVYCGGKTFKNVGTWNFWGKTLWGNGFGIRGDSLRGGGNSRGSFRGDKKPSFGNKTGGGKITPGEGGHQIYF